ncbi:MAG: NAD-dependent epimerase/dehydratase family protein [Chitinophagaceae bacterium]
MRDKILLTGYNGFVGRFLQNNLGNSYKFRFYKRNSLIEINEDVVIHLAGISNYKKNDISGHKFYESNTDLTIALFDNFLNSKAKVFIFMSSVKSVLDSPESVVTEETFANPASHYGKSKLLAENYILSNITSLDKRVYILRPTLIHGPENNGNLKLLHRLISKNIPWFLTSFDNNRSYCSIYNLVFVINELIQREDIPSGIYNVCDDDPISTNRLINLIALSQNKSVLFLKVPKKLVRFIARIGDIFSLPFNSELLGKLTGTYIVSNRKLIDAIGKRLPFSVVEGLNLTFKHFNKY